MKTLNLFLFLITFSVFSWGADISVKARNYTRSCVYFSTVEADITVSFRDTTLPWGSEITLVSGWAGREGFPEKRFEWSDREENIARAKAPYTWTTTLKKTLHSRTEAVFRDTLNFVFKVSVPGRSPYFVNGGTPWGFYSSLVTENGLGRCVTGLDDLPEFKALEVKIIEKN
jgi:hypothetical protein